MTHAGMRLVARVLSAAAVAAVVWMSTMAAAQGPAPEVRAMWVSRFEWPSSNQATAKANIDNIMQKLKDNNFNTVLFQVRGQCDVHYPSPYEPWSDTYGWADPGWDPLQYAIDAAHSRGLKFHAYINTHGLSQPIPPANTTPQHPYNLHGPNVPLAQSWVIRDENGDTATSDNYYWISPGIPEASWWTRRAILHVVKNYDVDGVHFDRIRTPAANYSYDPITVARFNGDGNPDSLGWADFMRSQITRDLRNIYGEIMLHKPWVEVSAAPFGIVYKDATTLYQGTGTQSYHSWYQDSWGWLNNHVLDFMVPQIYWQVGSSHPFELLLADWLARSGGRGVVAGSTTNGGGKTVDALLAEHEQTRLQNAMGHCTFSYSSFGNYWDAFKTQRFDTPTTVPDMPWKRTMGAVVGHVRDLQGNPVVDARVNLQGDPKNYLSAHDGFFAILDAPTGQPLRVDAIKAGVGEARVVNIIANPGQATLVELVLSNSRGAVEFDRAAYGPATPVVVSLTDADLVGDGTADVMIASTTEPAGETLTLTEAPADSGRFSGTATLGAAPGTPGDGVLAVTHGDTLTVTYQDADDGTSATATVTDTAIYDAEPPVVTAVQVVGIGGTGATVRVTVNEPVSALVRFGTVCGSPTGQVELDTPAALHEIALSNLTPSTTYTLTVTVTDAAGNTATDDNGGACHEFRTSSYPGLPFSDDFEDGSIDYPWTLSGTGTWRTRAATIPAFGQYSMMMDSSVSGSNARNEATLTLDCSAHDEIVLTFRGNVYFDESHAPPFNPFTGGADFDGVAISTDGNLWYEVQPLRPPAMTAALGEYGLYTVDLSAAAAQYGLTLGSAVHIRFNQFDNYPHPSDGIAIDDVMVAGALADDMKVTPITGPSFLGPEGGPFSPSCPAYTVTNDGSAPLDWTAVSSAAWLEPTPAGGTLAPGESVLVQACTTAAAAALPQGSYSAAITFTHTGSGVSRVRNAGLLVRNPPDMPSNPNPADGATNAPVQGIATWTGGNADGYVVSLGTPGGTTTSTLQAASPAAGLGAFYPGGVLPAGTAFVWQVIANNVTGSTVGPLWSFRTAENTVDSLAEFFHTPQRPNDTAYQQWTFAPVPGLPQHYAVCRETLPAGSSFPVDVSGGTALALGDDASVAVNLTGGRTVRFFGQDYTRFYVGSNGYITFGTADTYGGYGYYLMNFFDLPRISMLQADLVVGTGRGRWVQLADRVAVGYTNVNEWNTTNSNSFMVEMFFDGRIRITCLNIQATRGIIGLSRGAGIPADYQSSDFSAYPTCSIPAPANLRTTLVTADQAALAWDDMATGEAGFVVERATGMGGTFASIATLGADTTSYAASGLTPETTYRFRVAARSIFGTLAYSNEVVVDTDGLPPAAPAAPTVTPVSLAVADVAWSDVDRETTYRLERALGAGGYLTLAELPANTVTFQDSGLFPATEYRYRVAAVNQWGEAVSPPTTHTTDDPPPPPATNLVVSGVTQTTLDLAWQDNSADETHFEVQRSNGATWDVMATLPPDSTQHTLTGLTPDTEQVLRVTVFNPSGGTPSEAVTTRTLPNAPAAPGNPHVINRTAGAISIGWDDNSDNEDGFHVLMRLPGGEFVRVATLMPDETAGTIVGLPPGTAVEFRVEAFNAGGSAMSDVLAASTIPLPPAAVGDLVAEVTTAGVVLRWTAPAPPVTGFAVERRTGDGDWAPLPGDAVDGDGALDDTAPTSGVFSYRVFALNEGGVSPASRIVTISYPETPGTGTPLRDTSAPKPVRGQVFGTAVAVSGSRVLVGAPGEPVGRVQVGAAYLMDAHATQPVVRLAPATPERAMGFGNAVALAGGDEPLALVAATSARVGRVASAGAVFVFGMDGALVGRLDNPEPAQGDFFGNAVATDGELVVVGAPADDRGAQNSGTAFVFDLRTRQLVARLDNPRPSRLARFGQSVAIRDGVIAVGAPLDDARAQNGGAVHLFSTDGTLLRTVMAEDLRAYDAFGFSVALDAGRLVVGAPGDNRPTRNSGRAYVFDAANGALLETLANPLPSGQDRFGWAVAAADGHVLVTAPGDDTGARDAGRAYVFDGASGEAIATLDNPAPGRADAFGNAATTGGAVLAVGCARKDTGALDAGRLYLFQGSASAPLVTYE